MQRVAFYARVSSSAQTTDNQLPELRAFAKHRGYTVVRECVDTHSTRRGRSPVLASLLEDARLGRFDVLLIWALDRLDRSMPAIVDAVLQLKRSRVQLVSIRESWIEAEGEFRDLLISQFAWFAQYETRRLAERVAAGLTRARAKGVRFGRPPARIDMRQAQTLLTEGVSVVQVAKRLGCSRSALRRALASVAEIPVVETAP